jgi:hypothetical protein
MKEEVTTETAEHTEKVRQAEATMHQFTTKYTKEKTGAGFLVWALVYFVCFVVTSYPNFTPNRTSSTSVTTGGQYPP